REEEFAEAAAEGEEKPARRAPAKKAGKKGDDAQA
ncbi:TPA: 30S ribosomal protein S2, partial [Stenotrophomonas maltophilia]|nr:30S ribosomal protein S2 [Stenotrophomonas maltophilia]